MSWVEGILEWGRASVLRVVRPRSRCLDLGLSPGTPRCLGRQCAGTETRLNTGAYIITNIIYRDYIGIIKG